MGLRLTKQEARLEELNTLIDEAREQDRGLGPAAAAEKAASIPPLAGTNQALRAAAFEYSMQLMNERNAIYKRQCVFCHSLGWGSLRAVVTAPILWIGWPGRTTALPAHRPAHLSTPVLPT